MPALAVKDAIEELFPGQYQIDVIDFAKEAGATWDDKAIKNFWDWALARPELTTNLNKLLDSLNYLTRSNTVMKLIYKQFVRKGIRYILNYKPDIVFSTHFFCSTVALFARERYNLDYKIFSFMTDPVRGHNLWVNPRIDSLIVATKEAKEFIVKQGQPRNLAKVMPFPLNKKFFQKVTKSREEILAQLGLDPARKTLLATSGGQGIGDTSGYLKNLYQSQFPFNIIAICGKNKDLFDELTSLKERTNTKVPMAVLGFVDNMHEWMAAADLLISKPGGLTVTEALISGLPLLIIRPTPGQEDGNTEFLTSSGSGIYLQNVDEVKSVVGELLDNPDKLLSMREKAKSLGKPNAAENILREMEALLMGKKDFEPEEMVNR
jgi:processive 1,2-diacylglycerol beta-glucosyltransferase